MLLAILCALNFGQTEQPSLFTDLRKGSAVYRQLAYLQACGLFQKHPKGYFDTLYRTGEARSTSSGHVHALTRYEVAVIIDSEFSAGMVGTKGLLSLQSIKVPLTHNLRES